MVKHNIFQMAAIATLSALYDQLWGFKPSFIRALIEEKGAIKGIFWFAQYMPRYEKILSRWGPLRTHSLATMMALLNGCGYSTHGHAYALQLHYLQQRDCLFPLTDQAIAALSNLSDAEKISRLEQALIEAELGSEVFTLRRAVELRANPTLAMSDRDRDLRHLIGTLQGICTACIPANLRLQQAQDAITKNRALRDRYAQYRASQQPALANVAPTPAITVLNPEDIVND